VNNKTISESIIYKVSGIPEHPPQGHFLSHQSYGLLSEQIVGS